MAADEDDKGAGAGGPEKAPDERGARERRQKPPLTIDLAAEDVRPKASDFEAPAQQAAGKEAPASGGAPEVDTGTEKRFGRAARALAADEGWRRAATAGVVGGLAAFLLAIMLQAVGLLPAPGRSAANQAALGVREAQEGLEGLDRRVTAMEAMTAGLPAMRGDIKAVDTRAAALEGTLPTLATRRDLETTAGAVDVIRQQLDKAPAAPTQADLAALAERVNKLEVSVATAAAGTTGTGGEGLEALAAQVTNAKNEVATLTARLQEAEGKIAILGTGQVGNSAAAVRAMAVVALRRAAGGGEPFEDEVDGIAALGAPAELVTRLRPYAQTGVKSGAALAEAFPAVADAIVSAASAPEANAGVLARVMNGLAHLVTVRPAGPVAGSDPEAIVSRMKAAVAAGDLATALSERGGLTESGLAASAAWAKEAESRLALDGLVEALGRALDSPAGTG